MAEAANTQLIKDAYAAFQRGDIAAILNSCDDNVEWQGVIGTEGVLPQSGLRRGKAQVGEFFKQVADTTDFKSFEPKEFIAQGDKVVVLGSYAANMKPSGQRYASDWVMVFTVRNGKVTGFREFSDSAQLVRAYKGVAASV
jgi:ketosteroid isomerase-like protein